MENKSLEKIFAEVGKNLDKVLKEVQETAEKEILTPLEEKFKELRDFFEEKDSLKVKLNLMDYDIEKLSVKIDNKIKTIQVVLNDSEEKVIKTVIFPEEIDLNDEINIYYRGKELVIELKNVNIDREIIQIINH